MPKDVFTITGTQSIYSLDELEKFHELEKRDVSLLPSDPFFYFKLGYSSLILSKEKAQNKISLSESIPNILDDKHPLHDFKKDLGRATVLIDGESEGRKPIGFADNEKLMKLFEEFQVIDKDGEPRLEFAAFHQGMAAEMMNFIAKNYQPTIEQPNQDRIIQPIPARNTLYYEKDQDKYQYKLKSLTILFSGGVQYAIKNGKLTPIPEDIITMMYDAKTDLEEIRKLGWEFLSEITFDVNIDFTNSPKEKPNFQIKVEMDHKGLKYTGPEQLEQDPNSQIQISIEKPPPPWHKRAAKAIQTWRSEKDRNIKLKTQDKKPEEDTFAQFAHQMIDTVQRKSTAGIGFDRIYSGVQVTHFPTKANAEIRFEIPRKRDQHDVITCKQNQDKQLEFTISNNAADKSIRILLNTILLDTAQELLPLVMDPYYDVSPLMTLKMFEAIKYLGVPIVMEDADLFSLREDKNFGAHFSKIEKMSQQEFIDYVREHGDKPLGTIVEKPKVEKAEKVEKLEKVKREAQKPPLTNLYDSKTSQQQQIETDEKRGKRTPPSKPNRNPN